MRISKTHQTAAAGGRPLCPATDEGAAPPASTPRSPGRESPRPPANRARPQTPARRLPPRGPAAPPTLALAALGLRQVLARRREIFTAEGIEAYMQRGAPDALAYSERLRRLTWALRRYLADRGEAANAFAVEVGQVLVGHDAHSWRAAGERRAVLTGIRAAQRAMRRDVETLACMVEMLPGLPDPATAWPPATLPLRAVDPFCRRRHHITIVGRRELDHLRAALGGLVELAESFQAVYGAPLQHLAASLLQRDAALIAEAVSAPRFDARAPARAAPGSPR